MTTMQTPTTSRPFPSCLDRVEELCAAFPEPLNLPLEGTAELYSLGYSLYNAKEYGEASHLFRTLVALEPKQAKYWKGFAACLQMQKQYEMAVVCYLFVQFLEGELKDLHLYVHLADCYFALKNIPEGLACLEKAGSEASKKGEQSLVSHVKLMQTLWSNQE